MITKHDVNNNVLLKFKIFKNILEVPPDESGASGTKDETGKKIKIFFFKKIKYIQPFNVIN